MTFDHAEYQAKRTALRADYGFNYHPEDDTYPSAQQMWDYIENLESTLLAERKVHAELMKGAMGTKEAVSKIPRPTL